MDLIEKIWNFTSVFHKGESIQPKEENLQPIEKKLDQKIEKFPPNENKNQFTEGNLQLAEEILLPTEKIQPTEQNLQPTNEIFQQATEEYLQPTDKILQPIEVNLQPTDILCNICDVSLKNVESLNIHYLEHVNNKRCTVNIEKLNAIHLDKLIYNNAAKETFKNDFTTFDDSMEVTNTNIKTNNHNKTETSNNKTVFEETTEDAKDNYTIINSSDSNDLSIRLTIKKGPKVKRKKIYHITADIKEEPSKDPVNIFPCHVCQDLFNNTKSLTLHIETLHSDVEKLTCAMCQKKFPNFTNLMIHTRKHLGIRPFSCHHCTKSFCDAKYLNDHKSRCKKVVSPNLNAKDDLASKIIYSAKGSSPCNVCRQAFDNYGDLRRHVGLIHPEQVDNLVCSICQQKIARFDALMDHTRRHLNIRPYSCAKCGAAFHTKPNVNQHVKSCHKSAINKDSKRMDAIDSDNFLDILEAVPAPKKKNKTEIVEPLKPEILEHTKPEIIVTTCKVCDESFNTNSELMIHKLSHLRQPSYYDDEDLTNGFYHTEENLSVGREYKCPIEGCEVRMSSYNLENGIAVKHMITQHSIHPYRMVKMGYSWIRS